ncbi:MAG: hypothetical protein JXA90_07450, partial [Planctomycetes bacterium]|nr:hypothetical protein [Planctomycetota bacterium]
NPDAPGSERAAVEIKRRLLSACFALPSYDSRGAGLAGSHARVASGSLSVVERRSGNVLWEYEAQHLIRHNSIALGGGRVYLIDRLLDDQLDHFRRRGQEAARKGWVVALDIESGQKVWTGADDAFGTWLGYSAEHDVLLEAGSDARDRAVDEVGEGLKTYRSSDGSILWSSDEKYNGPCILIGRRIITQSIDSPGKAFDLLTGERLQRQHPVSGKAMDWGYTRNYGCNTAVGSPFLLTFRSAAAGFFDLEGDSGTGNFGGFRSGCTTNLIPAGGVLSAPDYTRTCTCAYQNQSSLALVHRSEVELWTFNCFAHDGAAVQQLGLNFGAPGDRRGPDGTLWLDAPSAGSPSPDPPVELRVAEARFPRYHSSRIREGELAWVAASALEGEGEIAVRLLPETEAGSPMSYTVRLVFAEIEDFGPGDRVFSVEIQGETVLDDFDIAKEAGGPFRSIVREFREIAVTDHLTIALRAGAEGRPLLAGIQVLLPKVRV